MPESCQPDLTVPIVTVPTGDQYVTRLGWDAATATCEVWWGMSAQFRYGNVVWEPTVHDVLTVLRMHPDVYPKRWVNIPPDLLAAVAPREAQP